MAKKIILDLMRPGKWNGIDITPNFIQQINTSTKSREYQNNRGPIVKGHPADDDPAYGWWEKDKIFVDENGHLKIETCEEDYQPEFFEELKNKKYGPISIKLRPSDLSLKHIGFFGAVPTAVSGLDPAFNETDGHKEKEISLEFSEYEIDDSANSEMVIQFNELTASRYQLGSAYGLFRNMKNYFISAIGLDKANNILPEDMLANVNEPLRIFNDHNNGYGFNEDNLSTKTGANMALTDAEIKELQAKAAKADKLESENTTLKTKLDETNSVLQFSEQEKKFNRALQFCESDEVKKKLTPVMQIRTAHLISSLDSSEDVLEFKEDNRTVKIKPVDVVKELIAGLPDMDFSEKGKNGVGEFAAVEKDYEAGIEAAKRVNELA